MHRVVQLPRPGQVRTERLFHHHPGTGGPPRRGNALGDPPEQERRHLHVIQQPLARADRIGHGAVGLVFVKVAVHVAEQPEHLDRRRAGRVHVVELQRRGRVVAELRQVPAALGHPHHRDIEHIALDQPHQRGERLNLGQIPGRPEDHQRVDTVRHVILLPLVVLPAHRDTGPRVITLSGDRTPTSAGTGRRHGAVRRACRGRPPVRGRG